MKKKLGFTLIEMLVVVLILGILASIALPQYERSVWESRNSQLKTAVRSVLQAQKVYFMANGRFCDDFSSLDLDLPLTPVKTSAGTGGNVCQLITGAGDSIRKGKNFIVVLNNNSSNNAGGSITAVWSDGKYKCNGFSWSVTQNEQDFMRCVEARNGTSTIKAGDFCEKLESATYYEEPWGWARYKMP